MSEKEVINKTCNGECSRCGDCCGLFVPFNDEDVVTIKKYVSENNIKPYNRLNKVTGLFSAHCCFYNEQEKRCMIYPVRPYVCKDFMCNHKDWKKRRDRYEKAAKYNSTKNKIIMATFDDMIYDDYGPLLLYISESLKETFGDNISKSALIDLLKQVNRIDLLKYIKITSEDGKEINGEDLIK